MYSCCCKCGAFVAEVVEHVGAVAVVVTGAVAGRAPSALLLRRGAKHNVYDRKRKLCKTHMPIINAGTPHNGNQSQAGHWEPGTPAYHTSGNYDHHGAT